jgi:hypothetical protein
MWTLAIVEVEIAPNGAAGFTDALVSSRIHLLGLLRGKPSNSEILARTLMPILCNSGEDPTAVLVEMLMKTW